MFSNSKKKSTHFSNLIHTPKMWKSIFSLQQKLHFWGRVEEEKDCYSIWKSNTWKFQQMHSILAFKTSCTNTQ